MVNKKELNGYKESKLMMLFPQRNNENILITLWGTIYLKIKKETFDMAISISKSKTKYRKKN